jgi:Zn-dependent peptidase ImmA (M78 family)/transcriptional regulator with XRE-family HTH domain
MPNAFLLSCPNKTGVHVSKKTVGRIDRNLARRLREARKETGLSTRAVAARMPLSVAVSHVTLASYENGATVPPVNVLAALAEIYQRTMNWFLDTRKGLTNFRYRNLKARVRLSEQRQFEAQAGRWVEAYVKLERHLNNSTRAKRPPVVGDAHIMDPAELSGAVRRSLQLDEDQPIENTVSVLEAFSTIALELRASFGIDALAARRGDDFVVVLNPNTDNERLRMNAAHELAHLLYDPCKQEMGWSDAATEEKAYDFASKLLLPESQLARAFEGKSILRLIQFREKFGISLSSMIFRAEQSRIINTSASRFLWGELARRGWRRSEPGYVWRDRAISFETMLETAIQSKVLTWHDAEHITGIREEDLRQRLVDAATPKPFEAETTGIEGGKSTNTVKFPVK